MKKTLVIGASENPDRYSNKAIKALRHHGYEVVALAPRSGQVEDVVFETVKRAIPDLDTISLYIGPKNQAPYYQYIVDLNPNRVIFNPGTENPELEELLCSAGIKSERSCTLVLLSIGEY